MYDFFMNDMKLGINELVETCRFVGVHPDLVQGGGGNNSVKIDSERMLIKASGIELKNVTVDDGVVMVNFKEIKDFFYENISLPTNPRLNTVLQEYTIQDDNMSPLLRPSIEAGFHSLLKKYVIHSHSVYANILSCSFEGEAIFNNLMSEINIDFAWVKYTTPGAELTLRMAEDSMSFSNKEFPNVIILENHGLIIHSDNYNEVYQLSELIEITIKNHFGITQNYPKVRISKLSDTNYTSATAYINNFLTLNTVFKRIIFPDQMVYFDNNISYDDQLKKINIDLVNKTLCYHCSEREAMAIEETIVAYLFIISHIEKYNLTLRTISTKSIERIVNMESEKYRRDLLNT